MAITTIVKENPNILAQLNAEAQKVVLKMAEVGADALRENLSDTGGGRGVKYASLPNRSSAPGQYPIKQSGRLQGMVESGLTADGAYFGLVPNGADEREQALALELGAPRQNLIARAPVRRTAMDSRVHARMRAVKL